MMISLRNRVRDFIRTRKERVLPRRSPKPSIGAHVVSGDLRMTVQAGMSDELWHWLLEQGWREPAYRPDRRRYREVPSTWVTRLIDAPAESRARILEAAVENAAFRAGLRTAVSAPGKHS